MKIKLSGSVNVNVAVDNHHVHNVVVVVDFPISIYCIAVRCKALIRHSSITYHYTREKNMRNFCPFLRSDIKILHEELQLHWGDVRINFYY